MTHTTDMAGPLSSQRFSSPSSPEKKKKNWIFGMGFRVKLGRGVLSVAGTMGS